MNQNQAVDVLESIDEIYPKFELTEKKVKILLPKLMEMDYDRVMKRLADHAAEKPFPPTLAEIAAYAPAKNEHLEKMKRWEEEASKVSPEKKARVAAELQELLRSKMR